MRTRLPLGPGVGLTLLAALVPGTPAQQAHKTKTVGPDQRITVEPVSVAWSELLQVQAALPDHEYVDPAQPSVMLEPPAMELEVKDARSNALPQMGPQSPSVEQMGGCSGFASEPDLEQGFVAQADVPDGLALSYIPPDVAGSVGPAHLMVMLANKVTIQDRLGGVVSSVDQIVFWSALAPASVTYQRLYYDNVDDRWIATARTGSGGTMSILFAISDTDDPTGSWDFYSIVADPGATSQADWITTGYNSTWIAISANMFNLAGTTFLGAKLWAIDKSTALAGGPLTVSIFATNWPATTHGAAAGASYFPSRALDASDPDLWLINNSFSSNGASTPPNFFTFQYTRMSGTGAAPALSGLAGSPFGGTTSLAFVTNNYTGTQRVMSQVGDARNITSFSSRVSSVVSRNGRLWVAHSGGLPGPSNNTTPTHTAVCWYELNTAAFPTPVVQSGQVHGGATTAATMPSIAVNCANDAVVGFSRGDSTRNPEAAYVVRLGTDAANTMSPIRLLKAGDSSYWKNFGVGTTAQWGRYSSSTVDPLDDQALWTVQEYAALRVGPADNDSRWGTWWGRLGSCGAPSITDEPDAIDTCEGGPASFTVAATAFAAPITYQWRKDGVDIPGETGTTYSIASTVAADSGVYDCVVEDGCGTSTSQGATLVVEVTPAIADQPDDTAACPGGAATFTVVSGSPFSVTYQWRKDGFPLGGETADTLVISNVSLADLGTYDVEVTSLCGTTLSDPADLLLASGPIITAQPQDVSARRFDSATFTVTALGGGTVTYQWRKDTNDIPGATASSYTIASVSSADAGVYDVVIDDDCGTTTSDPATLTFVPSSRDKIAPGQLSLQIIDQPDDATACEGDSVSFSVTAFPEAATYQWRKDGNDLVGENSSMLTIDPVSIADSGSYDVVVSYHNRSRTSDAAELTVNGDPVIIQQPANQSAQVGDSVTFTVVADGDGPFTYQWRKRQGVFGTVMVPIAGANQSTFTIDPVTSGDSGTYDCVVSNECGNKRTRRAILTVSF